MFWFVRLKPRQICGCSHSFSLGGPALSPTSVYQQGHGGGSSMKGALIWEFGCFAPLASVPGVAAQPHLPWRRSPCCWGR